MKRTNLYTLFALITVTALLLSGCGSSSMKESYDEASYSYASEEINSYDRIDSSALYSTALAEDKESYAADAAPADPAEAPASVPAQDDGKDAAIERKIIKNADIDIESDNARECYASVLAYAVELGGYESSCDMDKSEYENRRYIYINATLKLPPSKLEEFVNRVGDYGNVTSSSITSDEITESYYDLKTRLESKQKALKSYYDLLEKAETIDDILSIQYRIDSLTEEIEAVKGKLRVYDAMVDESTVKLSITERYNMPIEEKDFTWDSMTFSSFLKLIKNGFLGVCNFLWTLLQWLVIILISASPILLIVAAVLFIRNRLIKAGKIRKRDRRSGKKKAAAKKTYDNTPQYHADFSQPAGTENDGGDTDDE